MVNLATRVFNDYETWSHSERDLSFHPATTQRPRRLSEEQIRFYNEQGYIAGTRIFSDEQAPSHRHYFDRM